MQNSGNFGQLSPIEIDPFTIPDNVCTAMPYELIRTYQAIPVGKVAGTITVASAKPLSSNALFKIQQRVGCAIENIPATLTSLMFAMHVIARRTKEYSQYSQKPRSLLKPQNREKSSTVVKLTPKHQAMFTRHAPFGQHLVLEGHLSSSELTQYLADAISSKLPLGEFLVQHGIISEELRNSILEDIDESYKDIFNDYFRELTESRRVRK